jgi:hypothetical protein
MTQVPASWMEVRETGTLIRVFVQPKASKSAVVGVHEGATGEPARLKVRVAAPPIDGAANEELLRFLKKSLRVTGARFVLERGDTSRQKDVFCENVFPEDLSGLL